MRRNRHKQVDMILAYIPFQYLNLEFRTYFLRQRPNTCPSPDSDANVGQLRAADFAGVLLQAKQMTPVHANLMLKVIST